MRNGPVNRLTLTGRKNSSQDLRRNHTTRHITLGGASSRRKRVCGRLSGRKLNLNNSRRKRIRRKRHRIPGRRKRVIQAINGNQNLGHHLHPTGNVHWTQDRVGWTYHKLSFLSEAVPQYFTLQPNGITRAEII